MIAYILTLGRLVLAAAFAVVIAVEGRDGAPSMTVAVGLGVLAIAEELSDLLDGVAARRCGTVSRLGGILDPLADSLARLTLYFALGFAGWVHMAVPLVMVGRDITVAYARIACATVGAATSARFSGKVKAIVQGLGIFALIATAHLAGRGAAEPIVDRARFLTAAAVIAATVWSGLDYLANALPAARRMRHLR